MSFLTTARRAIARHRIALAVLRRSEATFAVPSDAKQVHEVGAMRQASAASEAINTVPPMGFEPMLERV